MEIALALEDEIFLVHSNGIAQWLRLALAEDEGTEDLARQLRLRDILHMAPGDVIPIELQDELVMRANGVPSFKVKLGSHKGNLALQVVEPIGRR